MLDAHPALRISAVEGRERRLPSVRALITLGLVDVVGHGPELGGGDVVGELAALGGGPGACAVLDKVSRLDLT